MKQSELNAALIQKLNIQYSAITGCQEASSSPDWRYLGQTVSMLLQPCNIQWSLSRVLFDFHFGLSTTIRFPCSSAGIVHITNKHSEDEPDKQAELYTMFTGKTHMFMCCRLLKIFCFYSGCTIICLKT